MLMQGIRRLIREPFVHFLVVGAVICGFQHYREGRNALSSITITQQQVHDIAERYRLQYGALPTSQQLSGLVEGYVKEEILYREALKLGLDANDEIIRRRLVQKSQFLLQDLAASSAPTESQLRQYYLDHSDQYLLPATVTFTHVFFPADALGESNAHKAAQSLADRLNLRGTSRAVDEGGRFPGPADFAAASAGELERVFGSDGLAKAIFTIEPQRWSAPLRSAFGWHTVFVTARQPARRPAFEEIRDRIRGDYLEAERERRNAEAFARLRETFKVTRERAG